MQTGMDHDANHVRARDRGKPILDSFQAFYIVFIWRKQISVYKMNYSVKVKQLL